MPKRKRPTLLEDLPEEIIDMILIRLPSKDVGRCRVVSTSWHSATSTPEFMLEHHRGQPSLPIIDGKGRLTNHVVLGAGACSQELWPFLPSEKQRTENRLHAACDGLLIVSRRRRFYIFNPVTRKHALLCQPQGEDVYTNPIGFYRHCPTGEYRMLWVPCPTNRCSEPLSKSHLYVVTVGADEPRRVKVRMPTVSPPSVEQKLLKWLRYSSLDYMPPAHHRGCLHWCPYRASEITGGSGDIIVFDTEAESFRWMHSPAQLCFDSRKLFNMKGMLAFWAGSGAGFTIMDVWVMQDYEAEIWAFQYRIDMSTVEVSQQLYLTSLKKEKKTKKKTPLDSRIEEFTDMVVLNERELLIRSNKKNVLRCDIDGNFLGMVTIGKSQYCMQLTQHRLQESIIPFPYHGLQEEDDEPPFSMVHV
uniref:Uncharacterized protein n=1 Tax=Avena sativa TaxID=4498 RepID=A0ACD5ZCV3_AVESA